MIPAPSLRHCATYAAAVAQLRADIANSTPDTRPDRLLLLARLKRWGQYRAAANLRWLRTAIEYDAYACDACASAPAVAEDYQTEQLWCAACHEAAR